MGVSFMPLTCVTHYSLSDNAIGGDGAKALGLALQTRTTLIELS